MSLFLVLLAAIAIWAIAGTIVSVLNDGYRREPTRVAASVSPSSGARDGFSGA